MRDDPYLQWLIDNLDRKGMSQSGLARHLGIDASSVNRIVKGTRRLQTNEIPRAAEYFGQAAPEVQVTPIAGRLRTAVLVGRVEAGQFVEVDEIDDYGTRVEIAVPADDQFPNARLVAFDVSGDSMNKLKPRPIFSGDRLVCVSYEDVAHQVPLRDGMVVVVQRTMASGHMREWSVKQLEIYEDRLEFHPRSTLAKYKPIKIPRDLKADDGTSVEIIALVRRIMNDVPMS